MKRSDDNSTRAKSDFAEGFVVGRVGFEPTTGFLRRIMSPLPATNTASGPRSKTRKRQQKSPV
jgi:hypothetical protein